MFYFRTFKKYIVTIQYIYICHVWYMLRIRLYVEFSTRYK